MTGRGGSSEDDRIGEFAEILRSEPEDDRKGEFAEILRSEPEDD